MAPREPIDATAEDEEWITVRYSTQPGDRVLGEAGRRFAKAEHAKGGHGMKWDGRRWLSERIEHGASRAHASRRANRHTARRRRREGRCSPNGGWR